MINAFERQYLHHMLCVCLGDTCVRTCLTLTAHVRQHDGKILNEGDTCRSETITKTKLANQDKGLYP